MQPPDPHFETSSSETAESLLGRTEQYAREEPLKAVGAAFAAGLFLTILPVGGILVALLRLALMLLRPALLILGAVKLYEEVDRRQNR
jgi:hypothetical protein